MSDHAPSLIVMDMLNTSPPTLNAEALEDKYRRAAGGTWGNDGFYCADLVLIDDMPFTVEREQMLSKCGWSPFEGTAFRSPIASTWVNGHLVWDGRQLVGGPRGMRLGFDR